MTLLFISSTLLILLAAGGAVWMIHRAYIFTIDGLRADNKDLRDRLFQSKALPPSGIDLTEKYEEKVEREKVRRDNPQPRNADPLKAVRERWKTKDLAAANRGDDVSRPRTRFDNN